MHEPLFRDGSFDYVPIPDGFGGVGVDERTYGNTTGVKGRNLVEYFPESRRAAMANHPEFVTFTEFERIPVSHEDREWREWELAQAGRQAVTEPGKAFYRIVLKLSTDEQRSPSRSMPVHGKLQILEHFWVSRGYPLQMSRQGRRRCRSVGLPNRRTTGEAHSIFDREREVKIRPAVASPLGQRAKDSPGDDARAGLGPLERSLMNSITSALAAGRYFCSGAVGQWDNSGCMRANDEFCTPVPADVTV
jgi:hypothetical protein